MRRVLIVSPHFPPSDAVDMHRVRMTVGHYLACGWEPLVLHVRPEDADRLVDPSLRETLPADVETIAVCAPRVLPGLRAIGLRAWPALERVGSRLLQERKVDLVFFSTTAFPVMSLGRVWRERFGTPYALDFQDPWATFPSSAVPFLRRGPRHSSMRLAHQVMERTTVPAASGLIAVSGTYLELLRGAYPSVNDVPAEVSPFGFSYTDFQVAQYKGRPTAGLQKATSEISCLYAGRVAPAMERTLRSCFAAVAAGRRRRPELFGRLRFVFVGTGYKTAGNPSVAARLARETGVADQVREEPERISYLDAQKSMLETDILLILGSDDEGYIPSKFQPCLSLNKPMICVAPSRSRVVEQVADLQSVVLIPADGEPSGELLDAWALRLDHLLRNSRPEVYRERRPLTAPYEAAAWAARDCALFDKAVTRATR